MKRLLLLLLLLPVTSGCQILRIKPGKDTFYAAVLQQRPQNEAALYAQGQYMIRQGSYQGALVYFRRLSERAPGNANAWLGLGRCQFELHQYVPAKAAFTRALKISPSMEATLGLASSALLAGQLDEARGLARQLEAKFGPSAAVARLAGDIAYFSGDPAAALGFYRKSLAQNPAQPDVQARVKDLQEFLTSPR